MYYYLYHSHYCAKYCSTLRHLPVQLYSDFAFSPFVLQYSEYYSRVLGVRSTSTPESRVDLVQVLLLLQRTRSIVNQVAMQYLYCSTTAGFNTVVLEFRVQTDQTLMESEEFYSLAHVFMNPYPVQLCWSTRGLMVDIP